jgi:hypothetical protein
LSIAEKTHFFNRNRPQQIATSATDFSGKQAWLRLAALTQFSVVKDRAEPPLRARAEEYPRKNTDCKQWCHYAAIVVPLRRRSGRAAPLYVVLQNASLRKAEAQRADENSPLFQQREKVQKKKKSPQGTAEIFCILCIASSEDQSLRHGWNKRFSRPLRGLD